MVALSLTLWITSKLLTISPFLVVDIIATNKFPNCRLVTVLQDRILPIHAHEENASLVAE